MKKKQLLKKWSEKNKPYVCVVWMKAASNLFKWCEWKIQKHRLTYQKRVKRELKHGDDDDIVNDNSNNSNNTDKQSIR